MSLWDYIPKSLLQPLATMEASKRDNVTRCKSSLGINIETLVNKNKHSVAEAQTVAIQLQQIINSAMLLKENMTNPEQEGKLLLAVKGDDGYNKHLTLTMNKKGIVQVVVRPEEGGAVEDITTLCG